MGCAPIASLCLSGEQNDMNKAGYIKRYGEAAYEKMLQQSSAWQAQHREEANINHKKWDVANPDKVLADNQEHSRKGGKYYEKYLEHKRTGIYGEKERIRSKHARRYRSYKKIIALDSQIHHEWIPETADFRGVALVEKDQHMHGYIDVIQILEGRITLLTEEKIKEGS